LRGEIEIVLLAARFGLDLEDDDEHQKPPQNAWGELSKFPGNVRLTPSESLKTLASWHGRIFRSARSFRAQL
jgi:hypothetical protein